MITWFRCAPLVITPSSHPQTPHTGTITISTTKFYIVYNIKEYKGTNQSRLIHSKCVFLHCFTPLGPAYDISFWEVRDDSLLLQWKAPVYTGASPITGYFLEMAKKGSSNFVAVNSEAVNHSYLKVMNKFLNVSIF